MSDRSEITELRTDIKQQTEAINSLSVSIAQLVESYKHHKEITDRQGNEIESIANEVKSIDDKFDSFVMTYKSVLDGVIKEKEKKSDRNSRVIIGFLTAASIAVASFFAGITIDHFKRPVEKEQSTN